ncbi:MAG: glycosyltransferase family 39 protein [bacterium]
MQASKVTSHVAPLLAAAILLAVAVFVRTFDESIAGAVRTYSHAVGKTHVIQEALAFFRPFGKGEVALLIALALGFCGARRRASQILLSLLLVSLIIWPLKLGVGRERPDGSNRLSFPSGDVASITALCVPLAAAAPWTLPVSAVVTAGVAASRIYDGKHFPSDVLAAAALGILAGLLAVALLRRRPIPLRRIWFLVAGALVLAFDLVKLPWSRGMPYALSFMAAWGPLALLLLAACVGPALWRGRQRLIRRPFARPVILLWLLAGVLSVYFLVATASTLWDRDEPRFSRATVEMVESGDYLVPTFNSALRPDKPILIYWLMSLPVKLLGPSELACRMVAPLATAATGLMVVWVGVQIGGLSAGVLAFVFLAFSPLMAVSGTAATTDALLLACITAAIGSFLLSWTRGLRAWHIVLLALSLGAALLTKGPVGLAIPLVVIAAILIFIRGGALRPRTYLPWLALAVVVAIGLFLAWALPANAATGGEFLRRGLGRHVVERAVKPLESHGGSSLLFVFYYVPVLLLAFFPGTLYLPRLFRSAPVWSNSLSLPARRLLLCWALPVLILMSVVATKLPHYILPAWPALALLAALGAQAAQREGRTGNRTVAARIGLGLFIFAGVLLGLGLVIAPWFLPLFGARIPAVNMGLVFLGLTGAGVYWYRRGRHTVVVGILAWGMTLVFLTAALRLLPALERFKISPRVAACVAQLIPTGTPVATCGYGEPSLTFYLGHGPVRGLEEEDIAAWVDEPGSGVLIITDTRFERHRQTLTPESRLHLIAEIKGFNYSQGKWVKVIILLKDNA